MFFEKFLFKKRKALHSTHHIYWLLMGLSAVGIVTTFFELPAEDESDAFRFAGLAFACATALQYCLVYHDMGKIEREIKVYVNWTGCFLEALLRYLIIAFILFGVGKVAVVAVGPVAKVLHAVLESVPWLKTITTEYVEYFASHYSKSSVITREATIWIFAFGSAGAFFLLSLWNFLAFLRRKCGSVESDFNKPTPDFAVAGRILLYCLSAVAGFCYWMSYLYGWGQTVGLALIAVYLTLLLLAMLFEQLPKYIN